MSAPAMQRSAGRTPSCPLAKASQPLQSPAGTEQKTQAIETSYACSVQRSWTAQGCRLLYGLLYG